VTTCSPLVRLPRTPPTTKENTVAKRHPAEVTADRLTDAYERWYDRFDGNDLINMEHIIAALREIADGTR
jgi:hypothetical protein